MAAITSTTSITAGEAAQKKQLDSSFFAKVTLTTSSTSDTWDVPADMRVVNWAVRPTDGDTYLVAFSRAVAPNGRFTLTNTAGGSTIVLWIWYN